MAKVDHHVYDDEFFDLLEQQSLQSARIIVPILLNIVHPTSVLDVGCGRGTWLRAFQEHGIEVFRGLDGAYINPARLLIDSTCFQETNLSQPFEIDGQYDLAICLEVVEHLSKQAGNRLIRNLTAAAPLVLFSAAIPGQGGEHHINEQWPEYWTGLFAERNFRRLDPIRRHIWQDRRVEWWYRQNIFLYASESAIAQSEILQYEADLAANTAFEWIHIDVLNSYLHRFATPRGLLREVPRAAIRIIKRFFTKKIARRSKETIQYGARPD